MNSGLRSPPINKRHSQHEILCDICYNNYNKSSRIPLFVCQRQHQMCSFCLIAIRRTKRCPICRDPLDLENIRINKHLVSKLTDDPNEPNVRHEVLQASRFYVSPASSEVDQNFINQDIFFEIQDQQQLQLHRQVVETQKKRRIIYLVTIFMVVPFFLMDGYFGFLDVSQPYCTISKKLFGLMNLQSWFIVISVNEGIYLLIFLIALISHRCRRREFDFFSLSKLEEVYIFGIMVKGLICCVVELTLFFTIILNGCGGHIYGYGIVLAVIHLVKVAFIALGIIKNTCC